MSVDCEQPPCDSPPVPKPDRRELVIVVMGVRDTDTSATNPLPLEEIEIELRGEDAFNNPVPDPKKLSDVPTQESPDPNKHSGGAIYRFQGNEGFGIGTGWYQFKIVRRTRSGKVSSRVTGRLHAVRPADGSIEEPLDFLLEVAPPTIEFFRPGAGLHGPKAESLTFGLFDNAFEYQGRLRGPMYDLLNEASDERNFVGGDSQRFQIRVEDANLRGRTSVDVDWWTEDGAGGDAPGKLTLELKDAVAGIFVSEPLILVNSDDDKRLPVFTKYATGKDSVARSGEANYRIRKTTIDGTVHAVYSGPEAQIGGGTKVPVFQPGDKKRLRIRLFRIESDGPAVEEMARHFHVAREIFERIGIRLETLETEATANAELGTLIEANGVQIIQTITTLSRPTKSGPPALDDYSTSHAAPTNAICAFYGYFDDEDKYTGRSVSSVGSQSLLIDAGPYLLPNQQQPGVRIPDNELAFAIGDILAHKADDVTFVELPATTTRQPFHRYHGDFCLMGDSHRIEGFKDDTVHANTGDFPIKRRRLWDAPDGAGFNWVRAMLSSGLLH